MTDDAERQAEGRWIEQRLRRAGQNDSVSKLWDRNDPVRASFRLQIPALSVAFPLVTAGNLGRFLAQGHPATQTLLAVAASLIPGTILQKECPAACWENSAKTLARCLHARAGFSSEAPMRPP
jgi:hypothetical protein